MERIGWLGILLVLAAVGARRPASATTLGIDGTRFTLDGRPTFLVGVSYYGGLGAPREFIEKDLEDLRARRVNWIRLWATWGAHEHNVSAVDAQGKAREPYMATLRWLVEQADRRGIVVDVTLSRGNGAVTAAAPLSSQAGHLRAVETLAKALRHCRNVYFDVGNERNIRDGRHVPLADCGALRDRIKQIDPERLVTASHAGDLSRQDVGEYLRTARVDFLSPHRPRNGASPWQTAAKARECLRWAREAGRVVPVHYQEPFRRDFSRWQPEAIDFLVDARQAAEGGAAGWCLHNGSPRRRYKGPRRSFDLRREQGRLLDQLDAHEQLVARHVAHVATASTKTWVALVGGRWYLNGRITCPGSRAEGLLMNVRMVNCTFEDRNPRTCPSGFEPDANTAAFIAQIPDYAACGVRAFTLSLQGGMPGYEKALNSAFTPAGDLRPEYLARVERVIRAADEAGVAIILTCFYQRQDQVLRDEAAVRAGVVSAARWVAAKGFAHVMLEIANEHSHGGFDHGIIKTGEGMAELVRLARKTVPGLLVSASGMGNGRAKREVAEASDFILIHFNGTPVVQIPERVKALGRYGKAVVCNEDDKTGKEGAAAAGAAVAAGCSWGLMLSAVNQYVPFEFKGRRDDPVIYAALKALTTSGR